MNPPVGEHPPDPHPPVTTPWMLLSPWGAREPSLLELDKLWSVPSPSFIIIHGLRWHWRGPRLFFFFIDTYLISVRSEMYVFIVKTWHFFVMNYFIMLAEAVIKCVLFYDNNVIEGGCNKSCPGLFLFFFFLFFFFRCWMRKGLNKR